MFKKKFWHLLGGKGKDLLPLLLGGEGRTANGSETILSTTNGRADTLSRLSCLILLGSLGWGEWWWWHFYLYFADKETGSELSNVLKVILPGPGTQVCLTLNPTALMENARLAPLHLLRVAFWL